VSRRIIELLSFSLLRFGWSNPPCSSNQLEEAGRDLAIAMIPPPNATMQNYICSICTEEAIMAEN
jgi:hypothetical protein